MDILSFSVGEPDFNTPAHINDAAKKAIDNGATRYTAARGIIELRKAICATSKASRGVEHTPSEVVVSVGAKHTLFNLALALYEPGDEVIVPTPYWVSYPEHAKLGGATPVIVETTAAEGFRLTPEKLRAVVTPKTKALEFSNTTNLPAKIYANEGVAQMLFFESDEVCETSYRDRGGKYQGQTSVTLPRA